MSEIKGLIVNVKHGRKRTVHGAAAGHYKRLDEQRKSADRGQNNHKHHGTVQGRNGNVPELLPVVCTVQFGRFVQIFGNVLQSDHEQNNVQTYVLPGGHDGDGRQPRTDR